MWIILCVSCDRHRAEAAAHFREIWHRLPAAKEKY